MSVLKEEKKWRVLLVLLDEWGSMVCCWLVEDGRVEMLCEMLVRVRT